MIRLDGPGPLSDRLRGAAARLYAALRARGSRGMIVDGERIVLSEGGALTTVLVVYPTFKVVAYGTNPEDVMAVLAQHVHARRAGAAS